MKLHHGETVAVSCPKKRKAQSTLPHGARTPQGASTLPYGTSTPPKGKSTLPHGASSLRGVRYPPRSRRSCPMFFYPANGKLRWLAMECKEEVNAASVAIQRSWDRWCISLPLAATTQKQKQHSPRVTTKRETTSYLWKVYGNSLCYTKRLAIAEIWVARDGGSPFSLPQSYS